MILDPDLQSIQEVRDHLKKAREAQLEFKNYSQDQVDAVVQAMADAGFGEAARLGRMACEETGFGKADDKQKKNEFASRRVWESIRNLKTVGVIEEDREKRIIKIAEPMGVVAALIPSTNPTSTMIFKTLISVKARNAVVASPHPKATRCTAETTNVLRDAAERAGAPRNLIACLSLPTVEGTNELMRHKITSVILATGSMSMVRAAYSAGKPAYGVGPGNVPAFIERTADVAKAVADVFTGKQFDNGVLCSTESALICDAPLKSAVMEECKRQGGYFVVGEERDRLARVMFDARGAINPEVVGKSALFIAQRAGIHPPPNTTVLVAELQGVGRDHPLSREKLSPVLSFYTVDDWREGCHRCLELLEFGGIGHTLAIHSRNEDVIMRFALEKPAFRILVNTVAALGAAGYTNGLDPSLTLGPGTWGGSIVSDNVTARHLMNIKRLAYETNPINQETRVESRGIGAEAQRHDPAPQAAGSGTYGTGVTAEEIDRIVAGFLRDMRKSP